MWKKYLLYGIGAIMLLTACNKEDDKLSATDVVNWFAIPDRPGELGHLLHDIYQRTGISIFINDTLGVSGEVTDAHGNPVKRYETVSEKYLIYNSLKDDIRFVLSADTAAILKAARTIEKWVLPNLASSGEYRPKSFLLVDSLLWGVYGGDTIREGGGTAWIFNKSIETTPVGKLADIKTMDEPTLKFWAGMVVSPKVKEWLENYCADSLSIFYKMANSDLPSRSYSLYNLTSYFYLEIIDTGEKISTEDRYYGADFWDYWRMGFLEWVDSEWEKIMEENLKRVYRKTPDKNCDVMNYIAAVYAFSDAEFEAMFEGVEYSEKCIKKRLYMKDLVKIFEDANGIARQPFN